MNSSCDPTPRNDLALVCVPRQLQGNSRLLSDIQIMRHMVKKDARLRRVEPQTRQRGAKSFALAPLTVKDSGNLQALDHDLLIAQDFDPGAFNGSQIFRAVREFLVVARYIVAAKACREILPRTGHADGIYCRPIVKVARKSEHVRFQTRGHSGDATRESVSVHRAEVQIAYQQQCPAFPGCRKSGQLHSDASDS